MSRSSASARRFSFQASAASPILNVLSKIFLSRSRSFGRLKLPRLCVNYAKASWNLNIAFACVVAACIFISSPFWPGFVGHRILLNSHPIFGNNYCPALIYAFYRFLSRLFDSQDLACLFLIAIFSSSEDFSQTPSISFNLFITHSKFNGKTN